MTAQPRNVFIVQTAESNQNGRPKGSQIALINKQSALYKYKQQRKQRDRRTSLEERQSPPARGLGAHRSSWLLESRVPPSTQASDNSASDPESPPVREDSGRLSVASHATQRGYEASNSGTFGNAQLHDCYAGLRTDPFYCMPIEDSSTVLGVSDLCQSQHPHTTFLR